MKERMRRHVCEYCPSIIIISSVDLGEVYKKNKTPLRLCGDCHYENKHSDKQLNEVVIVGRDDYKKYIDDLPY